MTGRSSKSYKNRSGIGYITILWQNLGSASHVTLSGSPRRPGHLQRSLQPSATGPWLLQLLQHCVGHPGRHNAYLQASAVTGSSYETAADILRYYYTRVSHLVLAKITEKADET
jgi:hypothetical protein